MTKPLGRTLGVKFQGGLTATATPHAGVGLLVEVGRRSGVMATAVAVLPAKRSPRGLGQDQFVEALVVLSALGGDCLDDFDRLRLDAGLAALLGYDLPAASTARQWLDQFHDPASLAARPQQGSFIPVEPSRLAGLRTVVERTVTAYVAAVAPERTVTLDVDAHLVESSKATALPTYEGYRGYQPLLVSWAETGLILADEFRDGNVPASANIRGLVDTAAKALPPREAGWQLQIRSDSAAYEHALLDHWRERGWRFAVSADMSPALKREITALPPDAWHSWEIEANGVVREWAEVAYVPSRAVEKKSLPPDRYVAIRLRAAQGSLFADGADVKHFAIVSNDWQTNGLALLQWHRGKAGTIEHRHRVLKDELAAGVYPSAKFGANAAWLRLQVLTANLLELLKATALDPIFRQARPKRLRFAIFSQLGRVVHHARTVLIRLTDQAIRALIQPGQQRLGRLAWAPT
jgi:hypothetical protein